MDRDERHGHNDNEQHVHLHLHVDKPITINLQGVEQGRPKWVDEILAEINHQGAHIMAVLDALTAEVARNTKVDQSAIVLLNGLAAKIEQLKTDPVALQALADSMKGSSDALAEAIVKNTPAEEPPAP